MTEESKKQDESKKEETGSTVVFSGKAKEVAKTAGVLVLCSPWIQFIVFRGRIFTLFSGPDGAAKMKGPLCELLKSYDLYPGSLTVETMTWKEAQKLINGGDHE